MDWLCWLVGALVVAAILMKVVGGAGSRTCGICGQEIKRDRYEVTVDGERKNACATCASNIRRKLSKRAVDRMGL